MTPKRFMVIAGEASGDMLAAELVHELRAGLVRRYNYSSDLQPLHADLAPQFFGAGGSCMADAGVELAFDMTQHSVTGLSDVLKNYLKFRRLFDQLFAMAKEREPHAIICVDFSGFNRRFAAAVKKYVRARRGTFNNWEPKIIQYISPQVWASRPDRAYQMQRDLDLLLTIFPFEKAWYEKKAPRLRVEFVGHPLIERHQGNAECPDVSGRSEELIARKTEDGPLVVLLPGSRPGELRRHLPVMLPALKILQAQVPKLRARMVLPNDSLIAIAKAVLSECGHPCPQEASETRGQGCPRSVAPGGLEIQCGNLAATLAQADLAIASTGTVTMECAYFGVPTVTLYKTSWSTFQIGKRIVTVKWLTMPNLLANEEIFPEFIQHLATPENISRAALGLLRDNARRETIKRKLAEIIASLGEPGASRRAAEAILNQVP